MENADANALCNPLKKLRFINHFQLLTRNLNSLMLDYSLLEKRLVVLSYVTIRLKM